MTNVGIIGSGKWALAISKILKGVNTTIKTRNINKTKKIFSETKRLNLTASFESLRDQDIIFFATPSQTFRSILKELPISLNSKLIICSKGVEKKSNMLMSEVLEEFFPKSNYGILSGPNFSYEVIKGLPTATVISSRNSNLLNYVSKIIAQDRFRTYFNNDIIGTQVGGAMKNVIAIASGFILGSGLGNNANASIITRGLSEMIELGLKMGAKKKTFYGLSGIGDLTLTCSSLKSRNTKLGYLLAKKKKKTNVVVEGMESCDSICSLGKKFGVELPICNSVKKILSGESLNEITKILLSRPLQFEK